MRRGRQFESGLVLHIKAILLASTNRIVLFERDICPASGFLCVGEATTAQGLFQICEVGWQLRGESGARQVPGATVGLAQSLGLGGNGAATVLKR